ncbi:MAG: hypothetical protein WD048_08625 [Chitinophagales bacterium]
MPTRKELIEELTHEIERLRYTERNATDALKKYADAQSGAADRIERSAQKYSAAQLRSSASIERASERHSDALNKASENVSSAASTLGGMIFGSVVIGLFGLAFGAIIKILIEEVLELNKKTELIQSIIKLQTIHPYLTYRFIIERSYAKETNREQRQTILNGLISEGIITKYKYKGNINALTIEKDNPALIEYWKRLEEMRNDTQEYLNKNSAT